MSLWDSLTSLASTNQIFSGAVAGGAILGLLNYLRPIPYAIYRFIFNRCSTLISIHSSDSESFEAANEWAKAIKADRWSRTYRLRNKWNFNTGDHEASLTPHYGSYWFFWNKRLCNLHTFKEDAPAAGNGDGKTRDFFELRIMGRNKAIAKEFMEEIELLADTFEKTNVTIRGLYNSYEDAGNYSFYKRGSSKAPILKAGQLERIVEDIKVFQQAEETYQHKGIPYNRGYILHGPPGTGKTSIIRYLADACKSKLAVVQSSDLLSQGLASRLSKLDKGTMVIMEDLDRVMSQAKLSKKKNKEDDDDGPSLIDMSGFLNCLDGLTAPSGLIFIITANDISKLDPAIMRPGRVDVVELIDVCNAAQAGLLHERFFGTYSAAFGDIAEKKKLSPAKCQEIFIKAKDEEEAIRMAKELPECVTHTDGQTKQAA